MKKLTPFILLVLVASMVLAACLPSTTAAPAATPTPIPVAEVVCEGQTPGGAEYALAKGETKVTVYPNGSEEFATCLGEENVTFTTILPTVVQTLTPPPSVDELMNDVLATAQAGAATPVPSQLDCITTEQAKKALNLDVQRLGTEKCSWVVRIPEGSSTFTANLPDGWMATVTESDGTIKLYYGENGLKVSGWAATFRKLSGFPDDDAVWVPCELLKKEQDFGASEVPSFEVFAGNFTCGE